MTHEDEALYHEREALQHEDDNYDLSDYESAIGWQPKDKWAKVREQYRKKHPESYCRDNMLATKPPNEWQRESAENKPRQQLFGNLWRTGELAVLFGESGVGKSILAVQIAESIARGRNALSANGKLKTESAAHQNFSPFTFPFSPSPGQPVLYLDFEHSAAQFTERYSCPSPIPGKLPVRYRFSPKLRRTGYGDLEIPEAFNGDLARYFEHSLNLTLDEEAAKVIVIDNLSWLDPKSSTPAAAIRRMRSLKLYCLTTGASILVLDSVRSPRVSSPHVSKGSTRPPLTIPSTAQRIYDIADSVFAIARATFAEDMLYVKQLKSAAPINYDASNVLVYQLSRSSGFTEVNSKRKQVNGSNLSLVTRDLSPAAPQPFLGFTYLGVSSEEDLLRDYAAEAEARHAAEANRLKRIRDPRRVVDMIMSPEYRRYLKGD